MSNSAWTSASLGDVTSESRRRAGENAVALERSVYGVDRYIGLNPIAKYTASNLERYKLIEQGMFAYNAMRLNIGSIGYCSQDITPGLVSADYVVFECVPQKLDPEYLSHYINSPDWIEWTAKAGVGSVRMRIYYSELARLPILLPPLIEQHSISEILRSFDERIEVNHKMNATLESIAQAVFRQWFVNFPKADWETRLFGEIIEFAKGKKPNTTVDKPVTGFLPVILIETLDAGISSYADTENMVVAEQNNALMVMDGASSGRVEIGHRGIVGSTIAMIASKEDSIGDYFLYYSLKEKETEARKNLTGTSIPHMDKQWLFRQITCLPDQNKAREFEELAGSIRMKIQANLKESRTLGSLRDSLLPKLMRGEVRVKDEN